VKNPATLFHRAVLDQIVDDGMNGRTPPSSTESPPTKIHRRTTPTKKRQTQIA